ncbi:helix-turn-helix domain-containing protein [Streptomyces olivaceus]|uniref:Helix-turn-helix domain-containing protein n=1 Tax=Streptomyces olivaceus TaxID=47716 RepID=A0ABS7W8B0_STROV|nr:helix-turn-helix domain-containing protein [Streptomyces olivaceus]MBZ6083474.1 helix-turn-helix domain-containing protein [Streptomyces olivaceus]MBZ6090961.1 helix-turn-helix domain-containing protein [Streptomyces olivaceus]MBZ6097136.1 helix-turn-helix domain-containing protein [Streptomyces olivaceus]MBZ6119327.1 helix-turn-helix domain-containing protein [Streptomyces olivaceus]MBZ6153461.1 helix-turn-helix domain-containing protein [Streptomyces olivaceus]
MDTQNPSAPPRAQSAPADNPTRTRRHGGGIIHENSRHTTRFVVIGNHLVQHKELSLLAIGLGCHLQSLPTGAGADIKTLTARFPEGSTRIAAALRELEAHGYLRRERHRTTTGRIVSRTVSCNQPHRAAHREPADTDGCPDRQGAAPVRQPHSAEQPPARPERAPQAHPQRAGTGIRPAPRPRKALPAVPQPSCTAPALLQQATDLLITLRRRDPRLLLSSPDTAHLAPGVAAWLERDVAPTAVRHALTTDLPDDPLRRPAALLAHRLTAQLPPPPPFGAAPAGAPPPRHEVRNCDGCDRGFRAPETEDRCRDCRAAGSAV